MAAGGLVAGAAAWLACAGGGERREKGVQGCVAAAEAVASKERERGGKGAAEGGGEQRPQAAQGVQRLRWRAEVGQPALPRARVPPRGGGGAAAGQHRGWRDRRGDQGACFRLLLFLQCEEARVWGSGMRLFWCRLAVEEEERGQQEVLAPPGSPGLPESLKLDTAEHKWACHPFASSHSASAPGWPLAFHMVQSRRDC